MDYKNMSCNILHAYGTRCVRGVRILSDVPNSDSTCESYRSCAVTAPGLRSCKTMLPQVFGNLHRFYESLMVKCRSYQS